MKAYQFILLLIFSVSMVSCDKCIKGSGDLISVERNVPAFTKINLLGDFKLYIRKENVQKVQIYADDNIAPIIRTEVNNGELNIFLDNKDCIKKKSQVTIYISLTDVERIKLSGSGMIESQNSLTTNSLDVVLDGSGLIDLSTEANLVRGRINGSGQLILKGESENGELNIDGSGYLNAGALTCKEVEASISGSGNIELHAEDFLKARITGSGRIGYYGNPVVDASITGSGHVGKN